MRTTLDLPDDLVRAIKIKAARENRKLKDTIADLLKQGLARAPRAAQRSRGRVALPLVHCAHDAAPSEEMTPERVARVLLAEETRSRRASVR